MVDKPMTMEEAAIEVILAQSDQRISGASLHKALGLRDDQAPSKVLAHGVKDGRLVKDGKWWTVGGAAIHAVAPAPMPAPAPAAVAPAPLAIPEFTKSAERRKTKAEIVIDYLKVHGKSDTNAIREVLGMSAKQYPTSWLADAVYLGKIQKEGNMWWIPGSENGAEEQPAVAETTASVAENPPPAAENAEAVTESPPFVTESQPGVTATILDNDPPEVVNVTREVVAAVRKQAGRESSPIAQRYPTVDSPEPSDEEVRKLVAKDRARRRMEATDFDCSLRMNGNLELRRNGEPVAVLSVSEWSEMRAFINRVEVV